MNKFSLKTSLVLTLLLPIAYYFYPTQKIPESAVIDRIIVLKSRHKLLAYSSGKLVADYKISIGKNPLGAKEFEGDNRTPEGIYTINGKNSNSQYFKNLGVSYPNQRDTRHAKQTGKPAGGNIKIHGLKNGLGYIGKFHRWKDWTNGCIALTNREVNELYDHTPVGTVIEIRK